MAWGGGDHVVLLCTCGCSNIRTLVNKVIVSSCMKVGGKNLKTFGVDAFPFLSVSGPPNSLPLSHFFSIYK